jgi:type IV pilus assembly protein PilX
MKHSTMFKGPSRAPVNERGISVLFAMLALVALSAAAAGLVRTTSSNGLAVGNLALKADSAAFADRGTEAAIQFLNTKAALSSTALNSSIVGEGYYAQSYASGLDPTQQRVFTQIAARVAVDWGDGCQGTYGSCIKASDEVSGPNKNSYRYIITRLCVREGEVNSLDPLVGTNTCATPLQQAAAGNTTRDGFNYQTSQRVDRLTVNQASYRIVVRARGARNATTFTETVVRI